MKSLDYKIFTNQYILITPYRLIFLILLLATCLLLLFSLKRLVKRKVEAGTLDPVFYYKVWHSLGFFFMLALFFVGAEIIQNRKSLSDWLSKAKLIEFEHFSIDLLHLVSFTVAIVITRLMVAGIYMLLDRRVSTNRLEYGMSRSIFQIAKYAVWLIAFFVILNIFGVKVTLLLASSAALLVGVGLGLQQIFNDWFSGFVVLFERRIKVGDVLEIEGTVGTVRQVGIRTSLLVTHNNIELIVPNSKFVSQRVVHWTLTEPHVRFQVEIGVAYGSNVGIVRNLLLECASGHPDVLVDPAPSVFFDDFGDSALIFILNFFTEKSFEEDRIKSDLRFTIEKTLREHSITIPFPQRDIHIKTTLG